LDNSFFGWYDWLRDFTKQLFHTDFELERGATDEKNLFEPSSSTFVRAHGGGAESARAASRP
jgi:hypothetical protein